MTEFEQERRKKMGEMFPDYPCTNCQKDGSSCKRIQFGSYNSCVKWQKWFREIWKRMRKNAGKE